MARFGGMTALRAALGGVAGGLEGLGAMREQQRLEEEQRLARERQAMLDARQAEATRLAQELATRTEQRQALSMGMVPTTQFDTGGVAGGRDMPGATPRAPMFRQTIGGTEFAMGETPEVKQHREEALKRREAQRTQDANVQALVNAGIPEERAKAAVRSGAKYGDLFMTPGEQSRERLGLAQLGVEREKAQKTETGKPRFGEVSSLRKEFNTETRPYKTINDALKNIEVLGAKQNPTPQDDQALIYQFVKAQDPTSVVRESEYANAQSAIALTDRITSYAQRLQTGQKLTPTQRADMVRTARLLRQEAMNQYRSLADSYEALATSFGMEPKTIVANRLDRGFDAAQAAAKPSATDALAKLRGGK